MEQQDRAAPEMYFRPSLVIFGDEAGIAIYNQLCSSGLTHRIHKPLRYAIGLMRVVSTTSLVYEYRLFSTDEINTQRDVSLISAVNSMVRSIDTSKAESASYVVPNPHPHIYIVGHIGNEKVRSIVSELRNSEYSRANDSISCLFCCDPFEVEQGKSTNTPAFTDELSKWASDNNVHCCYLYGEVPKAVYDKDEFDYAAALSLFALLATGITAQSQFVGATPDAICYHGTLSTCLISVPHEEIYNARIIQLTALLLSDWLALDSKDNGMSVVSGSNTVSSVDDVPPHEVASAIGRIKQLLTIQQVASSSRLHLPWFQWFMRNNVWDTVLAQCFWLHLSIPERYKLGKDTDYQVKQKHLERCTRGLFKRFVTIDTTIPRDQWVEVMQKRYTDSCKEESGSVRTQWQEALTDVKDQIQKKVCADLKKTMQAIWLVYEPARAIEYCDALLDALEIQLKDDRGTTDEQSLSEEALLHDRVKKQYEAVPSGCIFWWAGLISLAVCIPLSMLFSGLTKLQLLFLLGAIVPVIIVAFSVYVDRPYLSGLRKAQNALINYYRGALINNCKDFDYKIRTNLIEAIKSSIECISSKFLRDAKTELEKDGKEVFVKLFKNAIARGDFYVGRDIHLSSIEAATETFLSVSDDTATRAYKNIVSTSKNEDFLDTNDLGRLLQSEISSKTKRRSFLETLQRRMSNAALRGMVIGSSDFSMRVKERDLWQKICKHFEQRRLCQIQQETDPSIVFLCANYEVLEEAKRRLGHISADKYMDKIVDVSIAGVTETQDEANRISNWILIASLCRQAINPSMQIW